MKRVAVTGGNRGGGAAVVEHLVEQGYEVVIVDRESLPSSKVEHRQVDLTDYDATIIALQGVEAVVHFAADAEPDRDFATGANRFRNNTLSTYNVFSASAQHRVRRVVWASSETVFGYPFRPSTPPQYLPIDEKHPLSPRSGYAMSKVLSEQLARDMSVRFGLDLVALRFSNILHTDPQHPASYVHVPSYWADLTVRSENLWGYIDARDAAMSVGLALEVPISGAQALTIAAEDSIMDTPSEELAARVFPGTPYRPSRSPFQSLLSTERARQVLGFVAQHSWRDICGSGRNPDRTS